MVGNRQTAKPELTVYTVRHSTRTIDEVVRLLKEQNIEALVDVRTIPRSRRNPQFNQDVLPSELMRKGVEYQHMAGLGGLRHARRDSVNLGWRNPSFRGFADYMLSDEFETNLNLLMQEANKRVTCVMCAEALPWKCHRSLISDALTIRGWSVWHIMGQGKLHPHAITPFAKVEGRALTYPGPSDGVKTPFALFRDEVP